MIAQSVEQSIIDQAMGVANAGAQKQIINTALYVLLHRTITIGCPLSDDDKQKYLSTLRGSSAHGILLSGTNSTGYDLNYSNVDTDNNIITKLVISDHSDQMGKAMDSSQSSVNKPELKQPSAGKPNLNKSMKCDSKQLKNLKNDLDKGPTKQSGTKNVQKSSLGSPGNTAPRVLRVKVPSTSAVTSSQSLPKVSTTNTKQSVQRNSPLTSSMKAASSRMTSSLHHLRTASPANLGRVSSSSKNMGTKSLKKVSD